MSAPEQPQPTNNATHKKPDQKEEYDEESKKAIKEIFKKFDVDNSGTINYTEIVAIANELGHTVRHEEVMQIFKDLDSNKDKRITFEEFWVWWSSGKPNKLEKLVFFKLKAMKLLKKAHTEFTRYGKSLETKYEHIVDTHYLALNYGSSPGAVAVDVVFNLNHESNEAIRKKALANCNLKGETEQSFFGLVIRMKSSKSKEARKILANLLNDSKRIIGLLNGPEMGKTLEGIEFDVIESEGEIIVFVNLKKTPLEQQFKEDLLGKAKSIGDAAHSRFEFHFGIKNTIQDVIKNPNLPFINWLFEGFLLEAKLQMKRHFFKTIRQSLVGLVSLMEESSSESNKLSNFVILSLLNSSKLHLTFKDMDNIKGFLDGLGLTDLNQQAPTCIELFKELLQDVDIDQVIGTESTLPIIKRIICFLSKYIEATDFNVYALLDIAVAQVKFTVPGLGDLTKLIFQNPLEDPSTHSS